ncbi:MAG: polysaccharide lyase [Cyclobacteriaceae bacterium]
MYSFIVSASISCTKDDIDHCQKKDLEELSFGFESGLEEWVELGGQIEIKNSSFFEICSQTANSGLNAAKFIVSPESYVNSGVRSELTFDQQIEHGDETYYAYSFYIPMDYQDVSSLEASDGSPNWQIFGQWHDQPDVCIGQTWDDIKGNSPPISVYYNYLKISDPAYQDILDDPKTAEIFGFEAKWDEVSVIALVVGGETVALSEISKGKWTRLKFHIKWSTDTDGFVRAWINDTNLTDGKITGITMLNSASHYFKFGLYRNLAIPFTNHAFYDDLEIY